MNEKEELILIYDGIHSIPHNTKLSDMPFSIGKSPENNLYLPFAHISSHHAQILYDESQKCYQIKDLESTNGTYINGKKLDPGIPYPLQKKDHIHISDVLFHLDIPGQKDTPLPASTPTKEIIPGDIFRGTGENVYRVQGKIGEGGMGNLYKAEWVNQKKTVVLKFLPQEEMKNKKKIFRFLTEGSTIVELDHPNIVKGYDLHHDMKYCFLVMEYIQGTSIEELLETSNKLSLKFATKVIKEMVHALQYLETKKIFHRDIKPANIILCDTTQLSKLVDFGIIKTQENVDLTSAGYVIGTPFYMSPEQLSGTEELDIRTDIYSLGATFYHMITGVVPFSQGECNYVDILFKRMNDTPIRVDSINTAFPKWLGDMFDRMMEPNKEKRIKSPKEILSYLEKIDIS